MKKPEAEKLVTDTFTKPYDETRFRNFVGNLFQEYEALSERALYGTYIPEAFRNDVMSFKRLVKFTDPEGLEVDVLAVKLASKRTLESARTMQRNFVARYLNGSRGGALKDAALVAFYADDLDDWRFSLVRMDYVLDEEQQKVRKELTPARRYSFLVGHTEGTHTARRQWLPVLQTPDEITLAELETAFNIETVTKEFFEQYKALYLRLKEALDTHIADDGVTKTEFEIKGVHTADFAKRLLGQIVFLYFLQKKGWLGVEKGQPWGTGPKDFMQRLYRQQNYTNFFNDVLERLFYDALATERQTQDHFYAPLKCKIPFLNGGLFEPFQGYAWDDTDILLDNKIFEDIFAVFDLYNFTVREDEPLDKEVAVDPEMLGKVFENLIPENERKGSGTFYTPREIVHYMCQESLINYLDSSLNTKSVPITKAGQQALSAHAGYDRHFKDESVEIVPRPDIEAFIYLGNDGLEHDAAASQKQLPTVYKGKYHFRLPATVRKHAREIDNALANVKVCDPAIGSGAFPLGILNEIVRARSSLNPYLESGERSAYDLKRHAIQSTIYGVDLEPSAVDIAKLRLWLSLVVDEDDFGSIKPLPNLNYKIVSGNSLLGFPFSTDSRSQKLRELTPLKEEYFNSSSQSNKARLQAEIDSIIQSEYAASVTETSLGYRVSFDFRWSFFEVFDGDGGFDIIIANPPYLESRSKEFLDSDKELYQSNLKARWSSRAKYIPRGSDLMMYFFPKALELVARNGVICFITENSWLDTDYGSKCQRFLLENSRMKALVDSKFRYFSGKDAPNINTIISILKPAKSVDRDDVLRLIHVDENVAKLTYSLSYVDAPHDKKLDVKKFDYHSEDLKNYKWGFLFKLPEWFPDILTALAHYDELYRREENLDFGQGLNVSADYSFSNEDIKKLKAPETALIPFFRKESLFAVEETQHFLIDGSKISEKLRLDIEKLGRRPFEHSRKRRRVPIFFLPRGIGRHFCCWNHARAYSASYVEIYTRKEVAHSELLALWAFCNSSLFWLLRELSGRTNLGGGMLKAEATDVAKLPYPIPALVENKSALERLYKKITLGEPIHTLEQIQKPDHKALDAVVMESLGLNKYNLQVSEELRKRVMYREDKSKS